MAVKGAIYRVLLEVIPCCSDVSCRLKDYLVFSIVDVESVIDRLRRIIKRVLSVVNDMKD